MVPDPQGRGFFVVKVDKIIARQRACFSPSSSARCRASCSRPRRDDYAREFVAALRQDMKVKRNESAIQALKTRLTSSGG